MKHAESILSAQIASFWIGHAGPDGGGIGSVKNNFRSINCVLTSTGILGIIRISSALSNAEFAATEHSSEVPSSKGLRQRHTDDIRRASND